jgi:chromosome segregation ATPase
LAEAIEKRTIAQIEAREQAVVQERKAIEDRVSAELTEIKTADPKLNENALFLHATKYGFNNLKAAYQNMTDMAKLAKNVQQQTATNIQKRNDPVSSSPGATGVPLDPGGFATAVDYLRAQQGK